MLHRGYHFIGSFALSALVLSSCAPADQGGDPGGSGGNAGTSGVSNSGGSPGSGGAVGSGGTVASGGTVGSGGRADSGGAPGTGGRGSGGAPSSGGSVGSGGSSNSSGGASGTGGRGTGGRSGTGGAATGGAGTGGRGGGSGGNGNGNGMTGGTTGGDPPQKTVRVFWLRPSDVPNDQIHPDGIAKVMVEAQKYYKQELGKTFTLNNPVVEVVVGEHVKSWYENTSNGGEKYWWSVTNMQDELVRRFNLKNPDSRWLIVGEISAEGTGAGGGGSSGWVILPQHDADGAAGIGATPGRWYGGMVHELGHAFGLPDAASTDGTPMSASFYDYPNTHFNQSQKTRMMSGSFGSFLF